MIIAVKNRVPLYIWSLLCTYFLRQVLCSYCVHIVLQNTFSAIEVIRDRFGGMGTVGVRDVSTVSL